MRTITSVAVHHTAGREGTQTWDAIRRYHMEDRGWRDIGYHYGIGQWGRGEFVIMIGRPLADAGAHVKNYNSSSIGVVFEGNFEDEQPHQQQLELGAQCITDLCARYRLTAQDVKGHREFMGAQTACPGRLFPISTLRGMVSDRLRWRKDRGFDA